jgi:sugar O-acyltransferase (sialic acid O-acetyltransferase NeuD family)
MPLYVVGAGGLGRETLDAALAADLVVDGFVDSALVGQRVRGLPVVDEDQPEAGSGYVIGIADPAARRRVAARLDSRGLVARTVVHPRAIIGPETVVAPGCIVLGQAHVSSSIRIGAHCNVQYNATVGHDSVLDDYVSIFPGANVSGSVLLRTGVTVGSNAVVLQGLVIGADAFIGAGAVVTRSVAAGDVVVGSPARPTS